MFISRHGLRFSARRRFSYTPPFATQARVTLVLSFAGVVLAGGVFALVAYVGSHLLGLA